MASSSTRGSIRTARTIPADKSPIAASHIARRRPDLVVKYGPYLWLDPGSSEVRAYTVGVVRDIVRRYDIDGLHIDDYFYPYREHTRRGREIPFPDDRTWRAYHRGGGKLVARRLASAATWTSSSSSCTRR